MSTDTNSFISGVNGSRSAAPVLAVSRSRESGAKAIDILSARFDSLKLVSVRGNVDLYIGRNRRTRALDDLVTVRVFQGNQGPQLELFRLESRVAASLCHKNINKARPPEEINQVHFSVIEHRAQTETLKDLLDRQAWLDLKLAAGIVHQIADALEFAHRLGVVHLMVEPESILLVEDGTVLLTDFGLPASKELGWAHRERSLLCPVRYVSPEQLVDRPVVDQRTDLYLLGTVLYQMFTDRVPFDSDNPESIKQKHISHVPPRPHLLQADLSSELSAVINCLLEKSPSKRFQNVGGFRVAFDKALRPLLGNAARDSEKPKTADAEHICNSAVGIDSNRATSNAESKALTWGAVKDIQVDRGPDSERDSQTGTESERPCADGGDACLESKELRIAGVGQQARRTELPSLILIILLALAVAMALVLLESAGRGVTTKSQSPIDSVDGVQQARPESSDGTPGGSQNFAEKTSISSEGVPGNRQSLSPVSQPAPGTSSVGTTDPATQSLRAGQQRIKRPATLRRVRKQKRRWQPPSRNWRIYR